MANPIYVAKIKFPLTEKPSMMFSAERASIYQDIFNLQNTARLIISNFVEEAPADGKRYAREDGTWTEVTGGGSGGGRLSGMYYPLPGMVVSNSSTTNTALNAFRGWPAAPFKSAGVKVVVKPKAATGTYRLRAAIYEFDPATLTVGSLLQDLGEISTFTAEVAVAFPSAISVDLSNRSSLFVLFSGVAAMNLNSYTGIGRTDLFPSIMTTNSSGTNLSYSGSLTYPTTGAPTTLPTLSSSNTASHLYILQP